MNSMKNWFLYAAILGCLSVVLAACSDEGKDSPEPSNEEVPAIPEEEEVIVPSVADEEMYQEVVNRFEQAGFTVGEPQEASIDMFRAQDGMLLNIDGDALLPIHIYKLDPSDKRLQAVEETGNLTVYLGSKTEQLEVKKIDNFIIHLHKAHPDYDEIMKVLDEI